MQDKLEKSKSILLLMSQKSILRLKCRNFQKIRKNNLEDSEGKLRENREDRTGMMREER